MVTSQKRILVPMGQYRKDYKSIHYALSLAKRLNAKVYILQKTFISSVDSTYGPHLDEDLLDLINSARQSGLKVSHHITTSDLKHEIVELVKEENIELLVFGLANSEFERLILEIKPLVSAQIIQVKDQEQNQSSAIGK